MRTTLISGGRVIDPARERDEVCDVLIKGDQIVGVGRGLIEPSKADDVVDARGLVVCPGLIDVHVHLRQPGFEKAETVLTGSRAAIAGGFATIACMPDTNPPIDTESTAEYIFQLAERANLATVLPIGACTKGREGRELAELGVMRNAGVVAYADADAPLTDAGVLLRVLTYASMFDKPVYQHAEDPTLATIGGVNAGFMASKLGLPTSPRAAEAGLVARDIELARASGGSLHISHISTHEAVELVRRAKRDGIAITCDVTPHHLTFTDEVIGAFDAAAHKVAPPLRAEGDIDALIEGLADGTIDCIASDHSPCTVEEKELEFDAAPNGVVGLETTLGVVLTELVHTGRVPLATVLRALTENPARLLRLAGKRELAPGSDADVTLIDLDERWTVVPEQFHSKGRNTPFAGRELTGRATRVFARGRKFDCRAVP